MDRESSENPLRRQEAVAAGNGNHWAVWLQRLLLVSVLAGCGLYTGLFLYHGVRLVLHPFDVDNSEAYLVYQGQRLSEGHFLYPPLDEPPYLIDNYPPVYPSLIAAGFLFSEPNFHWPRAIAFLSTCATAIILTFWTYRRTRHRWAALLTGLIYLSFYHVYDWGALARVDALGVLLAVLGIYCFDRFRSWKIALLFFVAALFTRQTLFAAPMALFFTLIFSPHRKEGFRFLLSLVLCGVLGLFVLFLGSAGQAWNHLVVYNANDYRLSDLWVYFRQWIVLYTVWGSIPLFILAREWKAVFGRTGEPSGLLFWFIIFAVGEALLCGKIGSAPNYLLTLVAATSVSAGVFFYALEIRGQRNSSECRKALNLPVIVFLMACLWQLTCTIHWPHHSRIIDFSYTPRTQDAYSGQWLLEKELRGLEGPVLSDRAGLTLMAGQAPVYQPFICTQLAQAGLWDQSVLLDRIENREFPRVILQFDLFQNWDSERFTSEIIQTLRTHYRFSRSMGQYYKYYLYEPADS